MTQTLSLQNSSRRFCTSRSRPAKMSRIDRSSTKESSWRQGAMLIWNGPSKNPDPRGKLGLLSSQQMTHLLTFCSAGKQPSSAGLHELSCRHDCQRMALRPTNWAFSYKSWNLLPCYIGPQLLSPRIIHTATNFGYTILSTLSAYLITVFRIQQPVIHMRLLTAHHSS